MEKSLGLNKRTKSQRNNKNNNNNNVLATAIADAGDAGDDNHTSEDIPSTHYVDEHGNTVPLPSLAATRQVYASESLYDRAKRVWSYINRSHLHDIKFAEQQEELRKRQEEERIRKAKELNLFKLLKQSSNRSALITLFKVTLIMVAFPIGTFFLFSQIILASMEDKYRWAYSGLIAAVAVNIVTIGFGIYAYLEKEDEQTEEEAEVDRENAKDRVNKWVKEITRGKVSKVDWEEKKE